MSHILAIRFSALGDVAMTLPVLCSFARQYPEHEVTLLSKANIAPLFQEPFLGEKSEGTSALQLPQNLHFRGVDLQNYQGFRGLMQLFHELKKERYDAVADLHDVLRSLILRTAFSSHNTPTAHIKKSRAMRRAITRKSNKELAPMEGSPQRYADVFGALGFPVKIDFHSIYGNIRLTLPIDMLNTLNLPSQDASEAGLRYIGIAPFARHEGKIYPQDLMEKVVELLSEEACNRVFLFGFGESEGQYCRMLEERYPNVKSLVGLFKMNKELALMSRLNVMLTMDSANMHLAALVATPTVSVWGATHPVAGFSGLPAPGSEKVQLRLPCRPCSIFGNRPCYKGTYECMKGITPETIVEAIRRVAPVTLI